MQLVAEGVSHGFGELTVLQDVSLEVREGEILALIGPSGCGKSTLLNILGGLLQPQSGTVLVEGAPPAGCLNPFTYVFQDFALLPWRTVEGNVALALEHHALDGAERQARIDAVLRTTQLSDFAQAYPRQLSGGMRQRVGIARALAVQPAILLLDEPLSALDAQTRAILLEDFLEIWGERQTTAVYVTHNLEEALRVADRVAVFSRRPGRIRQVVEVSLPRAERAGGHDKRTQVQQQLWSLIRDEAASAEREIADG